MHEEYWKEKQNVIESTTYCGYAFKKEFLPFTDTYWINYEWNHMVSGICFK